MPRQARRGVAGAAVHPWSAAPRRARTATSPPSSAATASRAVRGVEPDMPERVERGRPHRRPRVRDPGRTSVGPRRPRAGDGQGHARSSDGGPDRPRPGRAESARIAAPKAASAAARRPRWSVSSCSRTTTAGSAAGSCSPRARRAPRARTSAFESSRAATTAGGAVRGLEQPEGPQGEGAAPPQATPQPPVRDRPAVGDRPLGRHRPHDRARRSDAPGIAVGG